MRPDQTPRKPWLSGAAVGLAFALMLSVAAYADGGHGMSLVTRFAGCFFAAIAALVAGILWIVRRDPENAALAAFGLAFLAATVPAVRMGLESRWEAFQALAVRAIPLTRAIERFEKDHERPPQSLQELVPTYIEAIPPTKVPGNPPFEYRFGEGTERRWELRVDATVALSFSTFLYWPEHDYPDAFGGNPVERIGDWAYVHE